MPIYAYKCGSCGHAKDVLQKKSDAPLAQCPARGAEAFAKQVTAAGFQLKGSGWYVTDFRGGSSTSAAPATSDKASAPTTEAEPAGGSGRRPPPGAPKTEAASAAPASASASSAVNS